jgi:hypothetical protein
MFPDPLEVCPPNVRRGGSMKYLAAFLMLLSVSMFAIGCQPADEPATPPSVENGGAENGGAENGGAENGGAENGGGEELPPEPTGAVE